MNPSGINSQHLLLTSRSGLVVLLTALHIVHLTYVDQLQYLHILMLNLWVVRSLAGCFSPALFCCTKIKCQRVWSMNSRGYRKRKMPQYQDADEQSKGFNTSYVVIFSFCERKHFVVLEFVPREKLQLIHLSGILQRKVCSCTLFSLNLFQYVIQLMWFKMSKYIHLWG